MATQDPLHLPLSVHKALREQKPLTGKPQDVIKHVVILMQENRSFDHYFGDFPGVRGFGDPNAVLLPDGSGKTVFDQPDGKWNQLPYSLPADGSGDAATNHNWDTGHKAWRDGWHDNWIKAKETPRTMGYYEAQGVPLYRELAETFTICDAYHCSILSETTSNRNYLFSGYTGNEPDGTRVIDATAHGRENEEGAYTWTGDPKRPWASYPELLEKSNKSWKVYQEWDNFYDNNLEFFKTFKDIFRKVLKNAGVPKGKWSLYYFYAHNPDPQKIIALAKSVSELPEDEKGLYERGLFRVPPRNETIRGFAQAFRADVMRNTLPQVSYLVPAEADSEHPGNSKPRDGQEVVYQVLDALASNLEVWNSTVLFLSYDENDGLFDHVPPPVPPPSVTEEYVKKKDFVHGPLGLGIRVPFIVVSPWTTGGYVCSQVFDHTSQVRFLEEWLGVRQDLISTWRRTVAGDLTSVFDFQNTGPRPPVVAGTRRARPLPYQPDAYCTPTDRDTVQLTLSNSGTASAHLTLYPYAGEYETPQHFDVGTTPVHQRITSPSAGYRFTVTGPNGFRREFHGPPTGLAAKIALTSSITADPRQLDLTVENRNQTDLTLICNPTTPRGPETRTLLKAGQKTSILFDTTTTYGWYDLTLTLAEDPSFHRRLMGHIENGKESLTYIEQPPHVRQKGKYITNLTVAVEDDDPPSGDPPSGDWYRIYKDLNKGARGKYLYFGYESGDDKNKAITDIKFLTGENPLTPSGYTKINVDLNEGVGRKEHRDAKFIWTYFTRDSKYGAPITDLDVLITDNEHAQPQAPWHRIDQDLNEGAGAKYIYLIYTKE